MSEIVNVAPSLTEAGAVNVAVGLTFAAVTVTDAVAAAPDESVTVTWKTYVPLSGAVNVGFTAAGSDNVTAGPVPPVRDHAYVSVSPGSGSDEAEASSVTTSPSFTDWSAPALACGGESRITVCVWVETLP